MTWNPFLEGHPAIAGQPDILGRPTKETSMSPEEYPVMRLEIKALGSIISAHLKNHTEEIQDEVQRGIAEAVANFDIKNAIQSKTISIVNRAIEESMKSFFTYGAGEQAIKNMVHYILKGSVESQSQMSRDAARWRKFKEYSTYGATDRNFNIKLSLPVNNLSSKTIEQAIDEAIANE